MVAVSKIFAACALALGVAAKHRVAMTFQPYPLQMCQGYEKLQPSVLKEGDCHHHKGSHHPFYSFELGPYHNQRKGHDVHQDPRDCRVIVYEEKKCKGNQWNSGSLHDQRTFEGCYNVHFGFNTTLPRPGKSVRLHCAAPPLYRTTLPAVKTKSLLPAATTKSLSRSAWTSTVSSVSEVPVVAAPFASCNSTKTVTKTKTVNQTLTVRVSPTSATKTTLVKTTVTANSTSITAKVTITTTIVAVPTATIEETTTIWLAPSKTSASITTIITTSSSKAQRTRTVVEDVSAAPKPEAVKRNDVPTRAVVNRFPASSSLICYASIDGQWIRDSCPEETSKAKA